MERDVRDEINQWLDDNKRSKGYLAEMTGINYHTLYSIFKIKISNLSDEKLKIINQALGTNFQK